MKVDVYHARIAQHTTSQNQVRVEGDLYSFKPIARGLITYLGEGRLCLGAQEPAGSIEVPGDVTFDVFADTWCDVELCRHRGGVFSAYAALDHVEGRLDVLAAGPDPIFSR